MKLICYLSNGYPTIEAGIAMADRYVEAGCDAIEIDLPARDPYLEGENIVSRMKTALAACDDLRAYLEAAAVVRRRHPDVTLLLLAYEASILEIGLEAFGDFCLANGLLDLIVVGRGAAGVKEALIARGLRVSCYVQFQLAAEEVDAALRSNGFVYLQAKPLGGGVNPSWPTLKDCIARLRALGMHRSINCGVGVHSPEDVRMVREAGGDGVFIGSAILKHDHDPEAVMAAIREFKAASG
jgi:tryptophan synthase alpha chain